MILLDYLLPKKNIYMVLNNNDIYKLYKQVKNRYYGK